MQDKRDMRSPIPVEQNNKAEGQEWRNVALGEIFHEIDSRVRDIILPQEEIPVLSITRDRGLILQTQKFKHRVASKDISNYKLVHKGELVYGFPINEGVIAILLCSDMGAVSPAYHVWKPKIALDEDFFNSLIRMPDTIEVFSMLASTTVQRRQNLPPDGFKKVVVSFPPLPEQKAIAAVLRTVQVAKEACDRVIAATRQLKQSLLQFLFTYGPVPFNQADKVPLKETEIGRIPEGWFQARLGDIAQVRGGVGFPPEHQGIITGEYPFFKVSDMNLAGNKIFMNKANNYVSETIRIQLRAKSFEAGTIIFPKVGAALHTNKKRILVRNSLIDNNVMGVTVSSTSRCLPGFLYRWFETINLSDLSNPGPLPSINGTRVKSTIIFLPTLEDQREIASRLSFVDTKLAAEESRREALARLFQSLLHHLMTGKVRVTT